VPTRYDVSEVPPLGGYPAKQCPVRAQWDVVRPCEPLPPPPALARLFAGGIEFERQTVARLLAEHPEAIAVEAGDRENQEHKQHREASTIDAMSAGVRVIVAGRLPVDTVGRRSGEPDVLVAAENLTGYRAVDIKHHRTLTDSPSGLPAVCGDLSRPWLEAAAPVRDQTARKRLPDLMQLAHYQRMLEATGMAAADGRFGGIIGNEGVITWYDLDAPIWRTPSASGQCRQTRVKSRSTMAVYDFEFDFRLDITAVAVRHLEDPEVELLVVPVRIGECEDCPWWSWCGPALAAGSGDVSLVPGVGWRAWRAHRDHGVTDRAALAALDHRTATLVAARVDLRPALAALGTEPDRTPVEDVIGHSRRGQLASLHNAGVRTLTDVRTLDPRTAAYSDAPMAGLAEQIDLARAALGEHAAYRRRGVGRVVVPRADVEVDVDMENTEDGVYLWGALVTDRSGLLGEHAGYRAFVTWEPMTPSAEAGLFGEFWTWLTGLRETAAAGDLWLNGYCFNAAAENSQLRRLASATGRESEAESFIASPAWVDLLAVFRSQLVTGEPAGLKKVAALAGFQWTVADPGGATALVKYDGAVERGDRAARDWLLAYNEGDVRATLALREWLEALASGCPSVEDLEV
jgi:predicted RecB family nuclease